MNMHEIEKEPKNDKIAFILSTRNIKENFSSTQYNELWEIYEQMSDDEINIEFDILINYKGGE